MHTANPQRRRLLGIAAAGAMIIAAGPAAAVTAPAPAAFGPIRQVRAGLLDVSYVELGPAGGPPVILLHGWPYDIHSFEEVAPLLAAQGYRVIVSWLRGHGSTRFLSAQTVRNGQQAAVALDVIALMDALDIRRAILAGFDWGARTADIIAALWPERCKALVSVNGYLINNLERNRLPLAPAAEKGWWYQYYFATERGRDGYAANRRAFNRLIWRDNSPRWNPDDATYDRTAAAFDNPDHVDVVIHNYRWRLGVAPGEAQYDALERRLAAGPAIAVPTITLDGDADGVTPATDGSAQAARFTGRRTHRIVAGAGHNLPQEAPRAFADAVLAVDRY
jgi:pimeloyl-ACP methyl ester carboxylesterase